MCCAAKENELCVLLTTLLPLGIDFYILGVESSILEIGLSLSEGPKSILKLKSQSIRSGVAAHECIDLCGGKSDAVLGKYVLCAECAKNVKQKSRV